MIIQFNFCELDSITKLSENKLVLLFCLYANKAFPLEKKIATNIKTLKTKLNIKTEPITLLTKRLIIETKHGVFSNYVCQEPQCYLTDRSFLTRRLPVSTKIEYLHMISQRNMANYNNWIPKNYVPTNYLTNPLIVINNEKIYFPLEKQQ